MAQISSSMMRQSGDLKRPTSNQVSGGTVSAFTTIVSGFQCSRQTMSPLAISDYARRGISVDTKIYCNISTGALALLGDIITIESKNFTVKFTENMAGRNELYGIFALSK